MSDNRLALKVDLPEEALAAARALALAIDPRCAESIREPLLTCMAQLSAHVAGAVVQNIIPGMLVTMLKAIIPDITGALDQRTTKHVEALVAAYLAAAPAPAPPGPLQVEIVAMPAPPKKKVEYTYDAKDRVKTAEIK